MRFLKRILLAGMVTGAAWLAAAETAAAEWRTDFAAARELAQKEQRPLLVLFTGSDWCGYCIRLEADVLSRPEFAALVQQSGAIPVKLDFPARKAQSADVRQQNQALQKEYQIGGFPTLLVLKGGAEPARLEGYSGSAEAYLSKLRALLAKP